MPGKSQTAVVCEAVDKCSLEELHTRALAKARENYQATWPKCFRVEDLWHHAHSG
jgi:hypothetical protein